MSTKQDFYEIFCHVSRFSEIRYRNEIATSNFLVKALAYESGQTDMCPAFIEGCPDLTFEKIEATGPLIFFLTFHEPGI